MYPGTWAQQTPEKIALVMAGSGRSLTYRELDERSLRLAHHLQDIGLQPGDVVTIVSDNTPEAYEVYWAAVRSGLYVTFVNNHLSTDEMAYIVENSGAKALVISARVPAARALAFAGETMAFGGSAEELRAEGYADYETVLAGASAEPLADQPRGEDMLYSSGTTGRPKGIKRSMTGLQVDDPGGDGIAEVASQLYGFSQDVVYLSPAPVYHAAPLKYGAAVHTLGGTLVMMERFDAQGFLEAVQRFGITHTQVVPTMFVRMLKLPAEVRAAYDLSSLQCVIHAAAPCPVDVKRRMIEWFGPIIMEYYASTEAMGGTFIDSATWLEHPGSVGKPMLGPVHIVGEDGRELGAGEVGTIYFERPEGRTFSYHNDPAKTAEAFHPTEDWTTVGDLGYVDEEGYLFLTDRKAFMIISGGVNIYPQEIEDVYSLHEAVSDIAVIGVPDEEMGERVVAFVEPAPDAVPGPELAEELRTYARERIAHYKVPKEFIFSDDLPRTPTGKMVKGKLKARYDEMRDLAHA